MNNQGYREHIAQFIQNSPYGAAIFTEQTAKSLAEEFSILYEQAKKITNVNLKRFADKGEIERLQKGVYYRAKQTVFGKTKPNLDIVMTQLLLYKDNDIIGYETGASFLNKIGLTTLMPRCKEISTNTYRRRLDENCHLVIKKPVTEINKNNYKYLQFVDVIDNIPDAIIDAENPGQILIEFAKKKELDKVRLIYYARKFYSQKTLIRLIDTILEAEHETT